MSQELSEDQGITSIPKGFWIANAVKAEYAQGGGRLWSTTYAQIEMARSRLSIEATRKMERKGGGQMVVSW